MKILKAKQKIKNKNTRHLKFIRYLLTLCILLSMVAGITGCTKEYTADDIKAYARDTLSIRRVNVNQTPQESLVFFQMFQPYLNSNDNYIKA